jgi:hypothetical protein
MRYYDTDDQISDFASIKETKEKDIVVHGSLTKDLRECTWIIMALQVPLMIIYRRAFLVISGVFSNRVMVTRLRDQRCLRWFW